MAVGDHVFVRRLGYTHHGVEVADRMVVHFSGTPSVAAKLGAIIRKDPIDDFARGAEVFVRRYAKTRTEAEIIEHAELSIGLNGHHLVSASVILDGDIKELDEDDDLDRDNSRLRGGVGQLIFWFEDRRGRGDKDNENHALEIGDISRDAAAVVIADGQERVVVKQRYNLVTNNCEHFARWCVTGRHKSDQVHLAAGTGAVVTTSTAAAAGGIGIIAAAGEVVGLSGAGIMSGLATAGGVAGSGAVGGLAVLGVAPGVMSAAVINVALRDDEDLPEAERTARKVGRRASLAGVAGGMGAGVAAVSAGGSVTGLSAAGISSGLAAIGATAGGGMAAGSAAVIAAPAVVAAGVGYGSYRLLRKIGRGRVSGAELGEDTGD